MPSRSAPQSPPPRIQILDPQPRVDCGRYAPKRCVGDAVRVRAVVFADGHDVVRAVVRWKAPGTRTFSEAPMVHVDADVEGDTWEGEFTVDAPGPWSWTIEARVDRFASWRHELRRKLDFGQADLAGEMAEGVALLEQACERAKGAAKRTIEAALGTLRDPDCPEEVKHDIALGRELAAATERYPDQSESATLDEPLPLDVDRELARFGAWYELFPRSWGGFQGVTEVVPELAKLGFDVLYLPPIHPIGKTNRKGPNNALTAGEDDPGSPWAIGLAGVGGHEALHPELGGPDDFAALVAACQEHGIDVCIDLAIQCSADHPWLTEHPEWFHRRPDGSLKYAENPPKKYQDIYNVNFGCADWRNLWEALFEVVDGWVHRGVKVFRVDNPHTKPVAFWEWLIARVRKAHPDVVFLSEAFTRRAMMRTLGKAGFQQSYTYFTWKTSRWDLEQYVLELAYETSDFFRPNFFANTPDILHGYLQHGGPPAFEARLVLAATLSPSYGIYSGFEHFEDMPVREGSEEYMDSEKYEVKERALDGPLLPMVRLVNEARRANPALQHLSNIRFLDTRNDGLIAYLKRTDSNAVLTVVCLDPHSAQEGLVEVPPDAGLPEHFGVQDLLDGARYLWHVGGNFVRLGVGEDGPRMAHLFRITEVLL